jgi:hypothetical protein
MFEPELLAVYGLVGSLVVATLLSWARRRRELRLTLAASGAMFVAAVAAYRLLPSISDAVVTPLQEGLVEARIGSLYGHGAHAGPAFHALVGWITPVEAGEALRGVVRLNVVLSLLNAGLFILLGRRVVGSAAATAFALVLSFGPVGLHAAFSELPAPLLTTLLFLGAAVAAAILDETLSLRERWVAVCALSGLSFLAAVIRVETLAVGVLATASMGAALAMGERRMDVVVQRTSALFRRILSQPIVLLLGGLAALWISASALGVSAFSELFDPFNVGVFALPAVLSMFLPVGPVLLFVLGSVHALRRPVAFGLLPVAAIILFKAHFSAAHAGTAPYEVLRYMTMLLPVMLLLALFGFREIRALGARFGWTEQTVTVARNATALLFFAQAPTAQIHVYSDVLGIHPEGLQASQLLIRRDQQVETRYLLDVLRRYPDCTLVARAVPGGAVRSEGTQITAKEWNAVLFGARWERPLVVPMADRSIDALAEPR